MIASTASAQIGANPVATRACPPQFRGVAMYIEYIVKKQNDVRFICDAFEFPLPEAYGGPVGLIAEWSPILDPAHPDLLPAVLGTLAHPEPWTVRVVRNVTVPRTRRAVPTTILNVPMVDIAYTADAFGTGPVLGSTGFLSAIIRTAVGDPSLPVIQAGDTIQVLGPNGQTWFQGTMSATFVPHPAI
jgi:hypothetical protein